MLFLKDTSHLTIELFTSLIGLIIVLIPSWKWGVSYIKKRRELKARNESIIAKINNIDLMVCDIDKRLRKHIAKDIAEMRLSDVPTFICEVNGRCTDVNPALCRIYKATKEEMLGFGWTNFIVEEDRQYALEQWVSAINSESEITSTYRINPGFSGKTIRLMYRAVIYRNEEGEIIHILGKVRIIKLKKGDSDIEPTISIS